MLDLLDELRALLEALDRHGVDHALCGGLALAVHGVPRATVDIDLLVPQASLEAATAVVTDAGFSFPAAPMSFARSAVVIHRHSKIDQEMGDTLCVDLVVVTPALTRVWEGRQQLEWQWGRLWVVSREGLVAMKRLRGSGQDLDDIASLV